MKTKIGSGKNGKLAGGKAKIGTKRNTKKIITDTLSKS